MSSYIAVNSDFAEPRFTGHVWRDDYGIVNATVDTVRKSGAYSCWLAFDDPADARALATACTEAAEAMEEFAAPVPDEDIEVPF
jgi:hypothetical protein